MKSFNDLIEKPLSIGTRVREVDPNKGRCLVENCPPNRAVEFCYVISRQMTWEVHELCKSLEWFWGMRKNTLNLDACQNVFPVGASLHHMFEYILVPAEDIVQTYYDSLSGIRACRDSFPVIEDRGSFEYRLIPLKQMENIALIRQDNLNAPLVDNAFTIHLYPFNDLPTLVSHIHPKFVIVAAGLCLLKMPLDKFNTIREMFPILGQVQELYIAWSFPVPTIALSDQTYRPLFSRNDDDDNTGSATSSLYYSVAFVTITTGDEKSTSSTTQLPSASVSMQC